MSCTRPDIDLAALLELQAALHERRAHWSDYDSSLASHPDPAGAAIARCDEEVRRAHDGRMQPQAAATTLPGSTQQDREQREIRVSSRPPLEQLPSDKYTRHLSVKVVCDHGSAERGSRVVLTHLADRRGITHRDADLIAQTAAADGGPLRNPVPAPHVAGDGSRTWPFRCHRCGRDEQVREENLVRVIDLLREAGGPAETDGHLVLELGTVARVLSLLR